MLVLTRKENEKLIITTSSGERIEVIISKIDGNRVRLCLDAPKSVHIIRAEIEGK